MLYIEPTDLRGTSQSIDENKEEFANLITSKESFALNDYTYNKILKFINKETKNAILDKIKDKKDDIIQGSDSLIYKYNQSLSFFSVSTLRNIHSKNSLFNKFEYNKIHENLDKVLMDSSSRDIKEYIEYTDSQMHNIIGYAFSIHCPSKVKTKESYTHDDFKNILDKDRDNYIGSFFKLTSGQSIDGNEEYDICRKVVNDSQNYGFFMNHEQNIYKSFLALAMSREYIDNENYDKIREVYCKLNPFEV